VEAVTKTLHNPYPDPWDYLRALKVTDVSFRIYAFPYVDDGTEEGKRLWPALSRRIKKAGGTYSEARGNETTRHVSLPLTALDLIRELVKLNENYRDSIMGTKTKLGPVFHLNSPYFDRSRHAPTWMEIIGPCQTFDAAVKLYQETVEQAISRGLVKTVAEMDREDFLAEWDEALREDSTRNTATQNFRVDRQEYAERRGVWAEAEGAPSALDTAVRKVLWAKVRRDET